MEKNAKSDCSTKRRDWPRASMFALGAALLPFGTAAADMPAGPASPTEQLVEVLKGGGDYHQPPADNEIPNDKYGDDVRMGKRIFAETFRYARRYAGNDMTCAACHRDAGRRPHAAPMWAAYGVYPMYRAREDRSMTLAERIQSCFRFSLNGIAPALDAPEMRGLMAYMHFLARGVRVGEDLPGRRFPQIVRTDLEPSPTRGEDVYRDSCQRCHGSDGTGKRRFEGGFEVPPLWGAQSYNRGAGFARNEMLAGFIVANMPPDKPWSLTDQQAVDVAAFINLQIRPWDPRKGIIKGLFEQ